MAWFFPNCVWLKYSQIIWTCICFSICKMTCHMNFYTYWYITFFEPCKCLRCFFLQNVFYFKSQIDNSNLSYLMKNKLFLGGNCFWEWSGGRKAIKSQCKHIFWGCALKSCSRSHIATQVFKSIFRLIVQNAQPLNAQNYMKQNLAYIGIKRKILELDLQCFSISFQLK